MTTYYAKLKSGVVVLGIDIRFTNSCNSAIAKRVPDNFKWVYNAISCSRKERIDIVRVEP